MKSERFEFDIKDEMSKSWSSLLGYWGGQIGRCIMFVFQSPPLEPIPSLRNVHAYRTHKKR